MDYSAIFRKVQTGESQGEIVIGDCLDVMCQMSDGGVGLVVTDPPYNVGKDYGIYSDDNLPDRDFLAWYAQVAIELFRIHAGGYVYVSCSVKQMWELRPIWEAAGFTWVMMLIWDGPNFASRGSAIRLPWRCLYEPIFMLRKGPRLNMLNEIQGIRSSAVLTHPRPQRNYVGHQRRVHVTQKPVGLYRALIARTPGDLVFDPFMGSGTTAIAAKGLGRRWFGCDINRDYVTLANERVEVQLGPLLCLSAQGTQTPLLGMEEAL